MAVSYASKVVESNPYVLPVDLNLLAKVNNYKQTKFYEGADRITNEFNQLNSMYIMNKNQQELAKSKINNLTTQLNNMGSINYGDLNITHQIDGFASDIANDPAIVNGVISTKNIQAFEDNVEKMATDPKLSKYYNVSNITRIREQMIKPYIDGDVNAKYTGPKAPRPYDGNPFEKMLKAMKNLPPDITVRADASGSPALYKISTNTYLSPEDISATFDGLIDANTAAQLKDDAWYNFDYNTGYNFTEKTGQQLYNDDLLNKKNNYEAAISAIDISLKTEIDPAKQKELQEQRAMYANSLPQVHAEIEKGNSIFSKMWKNDPEGAKYSLYVGKMRNDVIKAAGYSREKVDYQKNEEWAFERRKELEYLKHGLQLNSDGTISKIQGWPTSGKKDANGNDIEDPTQSLSGFGQLGTTNRNATETEAQAVNATTITKQINDLKTLNNNDAQGFIKDFIIANGWQDVMGYKQTVNTSGDGALQTLSSDLIRNITGTDNNLKFDDINYLAVQGVTAYNKGLVNAQGIDVKTGKPYVYNVSNDGIKFSMNFQQMKILEQLRKAWKDFGTGNIDKLPDSFNRGTVKRDWINFATKHNERELAAKAAESYLKNVNAIAVKNAGLSDEDLKLYNDWVAEGSPTFNTRANEYVMNPNKSNNKYYYYTGRTMGKGETPEIKPTALGLRLEKINAATKGTIKGAFETASKTLNYYEFNFSDNPKLLPDGIISTITDRAVDAGINSASEVKPLKISIADDGVNYKLTYTHKGDERTKPLTVQITPQEARSFGLNPPTHPEIETIFRFGAQESPELFIPHPNFDQAIHYKIRKLTDHYQPFFLYQGKEYPIPLPEKALLASNAVDAMNTIMNEPFGSYNELIQNLKDHKIIPQN